MYIPQFWCGVGATILVEILGFIGIITYNTVKANKKTLQKDTEKNGKMQENQRLEIKEGE